MADKLAASNTSNKKDSKGRRLGGKIFPGQPVKAGAIIIRQRGSKGYSDLNTTMGRDFTINSVIDGKVIAFKRGNRNFVKVTRDL